MSGPDLRLLATLPEQERPVLLAHLLDELRDRLGVQTLSVTRDRSGWWAETEHATVSARTLCEALDQLAVREVSGPVKRDEELEDLQHDVKRGVWPYASTR